MRVRGEGSGGVCGRWLRACMDSFPLPCRAMPLPQHPHLAKSQLHARMRPFASMTVARENHASL